jgi:hypothetical protein
MTPSFISLCVTGILILIIIIMMIYNYNKISSIKLISLLTLLTIAIGIHGLQHLGQEVYYDYNPLINNNFPLDKPIRA